MSVQVDMHAATANEETNGDASSSSSSSSNAHMVIANTGNSSNSNSSGNNFNPQLLLDSFSKCLTEHERQEEDILLDEYLRAYEEINKFLACLGSIFYFVITDVRDKVATLHSMRQRMPDEYASLVRIVDYEKSAGLFDAPASLARRSAARTILRLHRALLFIYTFLDRVYNVDNTSSSASSKSSHIGTETYEATLGKHHSWIVRKAVRVGLLGLPKRDTLVGYMCHTPEHHANFPQFIRTVERVYNITQTLFEKHSILNLP